MFKNFKSQISNLKSPRGFTLLEIMIAMAILAGVVVTIISALNYHLSYVERIKDETIAVILAKEKLEEIRVSGVRQIRKGDFSQRFDGFRWKYDAEELKIKGIQKIYLTVFWKKDNRFTLETYEIKK